MIRKGITILGICGFALAGCAGNTADQGQNGTEKAGIFNESGSQLHTNNHEPDFYNPGMNNDDTSFGYVRYKRAGVMGADDQPKYEIDREQLANVISKLGAQVPNVDDVSTLVTDEEVLMVYESDSDNPSDTAEQVKKMAMSVVPGWFHIYVSDDTDLRQNVENFATLKTNSHDVDILIDKLIKQLEKSPQGQDTADSSYDNNQRESEGNNMNTQQ